MSSASVPSYGKRENIELTERRAKQSNQDACVCVFNHVGISVPDCEAAVAWYSSVFGLRLLKPVLHLKREQFPGAPIFKLFDDALQEFKLAWLGTGHSVGLEIFEFIDPCHRTPEGPAFDYSRGGVFHIAMTVTDPEKLCREVVKAGGSRMGELIPMPMGNAVAYCQDPWGNAIELLTTSFANMVANGAPKDD
ncbi:Glyoxalase/Bleomycin resistance protein/Dihydroxybiphenyl dioxygenase [Lindgomyces ingoldianus]|uniref:Glyoxalase/Bleomycin resistance protein/Dihydroxybiphenyl dioxygenase n=1 Tax=Lindgomyces ingoldianus TaxID=673940 RepID=A0ACB6QCC2_9PLEO|nr:Glyoxalase/Bleomycin resistance protein/Dihydroxybiphenyl dioxygenase [Lindgomyces ingoldianus]KAF2464022.1 Glyoxalase/Bleomycin resistance protein/Dihydroxybiphenyl dioxygenase [Lindgomyces ingoldianus]